MKQENPPLSEFQFYITAQVQKINKTLQVHRQELDKSNEVNTILKRQQKKQDDLENKIKLLEVYQCENFKNNQRIYNSHNNFDLLEKRIYLLEEIQVQSDEPNKHQQAVRHEHSDQLSKIKKRIADIEIEIEKSRDKNRILNKFKREISPRTVNCESTKDISIDNYSIGNQFKRIEKKLQGFVLEKLKIFEKKYFTPMPEPKTNEENYWMPQKQPLKQSRYSDIQTKKKEEPQNYLRNKIDTYYTQPTEKEEMEDKYQSEARFPKLFSKKQLKKVKSYSKSKSKKKGKSSSKNKVNLNSVNAYLKLKQK